MNGSAKRIRVLVVEDSLVQRELQVHLLEQDPQCEVVGTARDGREAVEQVRRIRPDVVAMDFHMPKMNGAEATRIIMETSPVPIVVISGSSARGEVAETFRVLDAGALIIIEKPGSPDGDAARKFVETIKLMAEIRVVRRWPGRGATKSTDSSMPRPALLAGSTVRLVAIGASTGGPVALEGLLSMLPSDFSAPVAIVQHISPGFTEGFAEWLSDACGFPVSVAGDDERLDPGHAYVAPEGSHMTVKADAHGHCRVRLSSEAQENGHRPSVSPFFRSVAAELGGRAIGVLLSGMGKDGAAELHALRETGAVTIAQDCESSVVPGMPGEAIRLDAAVHVLPPDQIGRLLASLVKQRNGSQ